MLIFDSFPNRAEAEEFAYAVTKRFERKATVYDTQDESDAVDPFPFHLMPPIVLVERVHGMVHGSEHRVSKFVRHFNGKFAGT